MNMNITRFGRTELHLACRNNDASAVRRLIDERVEEIDTKDAHGFSGLYHAAMFGHVECMAMLLNAGACISSTDLGGLSVLHIACEKGQLAAVRLLLERGAELSTRDSIGRTPRDWAEVKGHSAILHALDEWEQYMHHQCRPTATETSSEIIDDQIAEILT